MVVSYQVEFEHETPTIEEVARRFREATGLELKVEPFGASSFALSAVPLRGDVELMLGRGARLLVFRAHLGYFEWAILRALQRLGGRVPAHVFPRYADVPWTSLAWYSRWLHR